jgi:serine/threonine protein kinase
MPPGQYGEVYLGRLLDRSSQQQTPVAIKTTKEDRSTKQEAIEFLQEATIMKEFRHENIMALVGVVVEQDKALVLFPFMENGDLRSFISNDGNVSVGFNPNIGVADMRRMSAPLSVHAVDCQYMWFLENGT